MRGTTLRIRFLVLLGLLNGNEAFANPNGVQVVNGQVQFAQPDPNTLNITNSHGAIINWQQFSIQHNEITRFIQQNAASAILNRVVSQNPSALLGQLLSNGRVFLINPNGIVFGPNSVIDTAGFIASTLNMTDEDFIAENLKFQGDNTAGTIHNKGYIKAGKNGDIYLIAPNIENSGIIETDGGQIILAAGESITIASLDSDHIVFDVQAPEHEVVNLGEMITNGGAAGMFAGTIKHSGSVNADSLGIDPSGNIVLSASRSITLNKGSTLTASGWISADGGNVKLIAQGGSGDETALIYQDGDIHANGKQGGSIDLVADDILLAGNMTADGEQDGGSVNVDATGQILATATSEISASGNNGTGGEIQLMAAESLYTSASYDVTGSKGGQVKLLGNEVKIAGANVDASGDEGAGTINVGGGFQGQDASTPNAENTWVNASASLKADALQSGDGGTVIVWADVETYFTGNISVTGGENAGNGGFVEVSGKEVLKYGGTVALTAQAGELGTLLLDPKIITVSGGGGGGTVSSSDLLSLGPGSFNNFGDDPVSGEKKAVVELTNGNLLVIDNNSDFGGSGRGAVYIFDTNSTLVGTILGASDFDRVGSGGVTVLANGNFVISSPSVDILGINAAGAATLHNGTTGEFINGGGGYGAVTSLNSLYGTNSSDNISGSGVAALSNGNYVVLSRRWNSFRGAVTLGSGVSGITGPVSNTNSIISFTTNNSLVIGGTDDFTELSNGNFVIHSSSFRTGTGSSNNRGVVTLLNGTTGEFVNDTDTGNACTPPNCGYGFIDFDNSLLGSGADRVSNGGVVALSNGNYVVSSYLWDGNSSFSTIREFGAVSLMDGSTGEFVNGGGVTGINSSNSLIGSTGRAFDWVGVGGVTELANGNYVVASYFWNSSTGAVSQMDGDTGQFVNGGGVTGISATNSIIGGITASDETGRDLIFLNNGNYVIGSPDTGASTLVNGNTGQFVIGGGVGAISAGNSLVLNNAYDPFLTSDFEPLTALSSGNFVFSNPENNVGGLNGSVVLVNGTTGIEIGRVDGYANDIEMGDGGVHELTNGNYVILTMDAGDNGSSGDFMGTILASGSTGLAIGQALDLDAGSTGEDNSLVVLSNGNYVELAPQESTNSLSDNGIVRLLDGTTGLEIARIEGDDNNDFLGDCFTSSCITDLGSGHFAISNPFENNGGVSDVGSVIVVDSTTGVEVDRVTGTIAFDNIGSEGIIKLAGGKFVVLSPFADSTMPTDDGRITVVSVGSTATTNLVFSDTPSTDSILSAASIKAALEGGNLILQSNSDFILDAGNDILVSNAGAGGSLTIKVGRSVILNSNIVTDNGNLTIVGNETLANGVSTTDRDPGAAVISMAAGTSIDAGTGNVSINLSDGAGRTGTQALAGTVTLNDITANTVTLASGIVDGTGTITGTVNNTGATLAPGASPGTLTINGSYVQGPGGSLDIELGGLTQGVTYDLLQVIGAPGTASLDGTLNISLFGGFTGNVGDIFDIITSVGALSGNFSTINTPTSYTFSNTPFANLFQLTILSGPISTTISQPDNNQVIVLNDFQDGLGNEEFTSGGTESIYPLREREDEEEGKDLACR